MIDFKCVFSAYDEVERELCGRDATQFKNNFPVCDEHLQEVLKSDQKKKRATAVQSSRFHDPSEFPGLCYIVLCPDTTVKIGYSNNEELLESRLKTLGREIGPLVKLAVLPGGFVTEAVLHEKFDAWRIRDKQERFTYSPEMAEYISSIA